MSSDPHRKFQKKTIKFICELLPEWETILAEAYTTNEAGDDLFVRNLRALADAGESDVDIKEYLAEICEGGVER